MTTATPGLKARTAGGFYLLTIIAGLFAEVFVRGAVFVRDDPAATAANILAQETFYRLGLASDLVMIACYVVVTLLFYVLFKPAGRDLSLLAAFFSLVGLAVLAAGALNHLAPVLLLGDPQLRGAFEATQLQAAALASLKMHGRGYVVAGVFFGVYMLLLGRLIFRSGFLPRTLGALTALGGLTFLTSSFASLLSPALAARLPDIGMLGGIAELALSLWLVAMGVNAPKWQERASAGARP